MTASPLSVYRYTKQWRLERSRGLTRLVDATPSRLHLRMLERSGWTVSAVARETRIPKNTLLRVLDGQRSIKRTQAAVLLEFQGLDEIPSGLVPRVGARRRIHALMAIGWTHEELTRRCGVNTDAVANQYARWVRRTTYDLIAAMYAELCAKPGPSNRTRLYAARRGFLSPAFWDDIDRDPEPLLVEPEPELDIDESEAS